MTVSEAATAAVWPTPVGAAPGPEAPEHVRCVERLRTDTGPGTDRRMRMVTTR